MSRNSKTRLLVILGLTAAALMPFLSHYFLLESLESDVKASHKVFKPSALANSPSSHSNPMANVNSRSNKHDNLYWPSKKILLEQTKKNPHETPPALYEFSKQLSYKLESTHKNPAGRTKFVLELEDCISKKETLSIETLCAIYLRRASENQIKVALSPKAQTILKLMTKGKNG
jgi:hypothetical protein